MRRLKRVVCDSDASQPPCELIQMSAKVFKVSVTAALRTADKRALVGRKSVSKRERKKNRQVGIVRSIMNPNRNRIIRPRASSVAQPKA